MSIIDDVRSFLKTNPVYSGSFTGELSDEQPLISSGILDSIGLFTLVVHLEKVFDLKVDLNDLVEGNFGHLRAIEAFVKSKTS